MARTRKPQAITAVLVPQAEPNPAHLAFAAAFVRTGEIKKACEESGYSVHYGSELMQHPEVAREITRLREALQKAADFSLERAFERGNRMMVDAEARGDSMAAARLYELLLKQTGLLQEKPIEKPRVDIRAAMADAKDAQPLREAWGKFLIEWKQRALTAPEMESPFA